jgi:hypothetical protein
VCLVEDTFDAILALVKNERIEHRLTRIHKRRVSKLHQYDFDFTLINESVQGSGSSESDESSDSALDMINEDTDEKGTHKRPRHVELLKPLAAVMEGDSDSDSSRSSGSYSSSDHSGGSGEILTFSFEDKPDRRCCVINTILSPNFYTKNSRVALRIHLCLYHA